MSITLDLAPEQEAKLRAQAQAEGLTPPDYLKKLAGLDTAEGAGTLPSGTVPSRLVQGSPEWKALLHSWGQGRDGVELPLEATSREYIYGDDLR